MEIRSQYGIQFTFKKFFFKFNDRSLIVQSLELALLPHLVRNSHKYLETITIDQMNFSQSYFTVIESMTIHDMLENIR